MTEHLLPLDTPYQATVLVGYLARAFNPRSRDIPYAQSPLWPIARTMVEMMMRDGYLVGFALDVPRYTPEREPSKSASRGAAKTVSQEVSETKAKKSRTNGSGM